MYLNGEMEKVMAMVVVVAAEIIIIEIFSSLLSHMNLNFLNCFNINFMSRQQCTFIHPYTPHSIHVRIAMKRRLNED